MNPPSALSPAAAQPQQPRDRRPDPDRLVARLRAEQARAGRGRLKIFFGACAGVGKTYAMLAAAQQLRAGGTDLVIGVVETHGRAQTAAMAADLEQLPLRRQHQGGSASTEFDLDGALRRSPALILIDELAHSNLPGSRHPKRWQDVAELLAAGIDVYSTMNVQHLETLNDVVSGITGVRVWETVPDHVFDGADEIVLVDLTPDELLQRLRQGKVYDPAQAERAGRNFFRKGNLIALRELALRRTADRVDVEMLRYRRDQSVAAVWQTRAAVLACISGSEGERIVRSAARAASRAESPWHAVFVDNAGPGRGRARRRAQALALLELAQSLGADSATLAGADAAQAVVTYARDHNLACLVVGRGAARTWMPWQRSFAARLARLAPDLEVTTVASPADARARRRPDPAAAAAPRRWRPYAAGAGLCALAAALAAPLYSVVALPNIVLIFLLAVVLAAVHCGRGPAVLAAFLSVATFDFLYVPPRFSFAIADPQYLVTFAVMLVVALVAGQLTAGLQWRAQVAIGRERRVQALYEMARDLSGALLVEQIAATCERFMSTEFGARARLVLTDDQGRIVLPTAASEPPPLPVDAAIAQWAIDHAEPAGLGTATLPASRVRYLPLQAPMRVRGLLALEPDDRSRISGPEQERLLDTVARLIAIALERIHYVEVAQNSTVQMESERLRNSLLAAISHDLRTPLAVLVGLADTLRLTQPPPSPEQQQITHQLRAQGLRLAALVENLLDMARLQAGRVALNRQWHSLEELVGAALHAVQWPGQTRQIAVQLPPTLPLVDVDASLIERVLCNLLENALKFTAADSRIGIGASLAAGRLRVWVEDNGPGLPPGREEAIFDKFERGQRESATPGVGLGLAICRAIVQAHGGTIRGHQRPGGGAHFVFELPVGVAPAAPAEAPEQTHERAQVGEQTAATAPGGPPP